MGKPGIHDWSRPRSILVATDRAEIDRLFGLALIEAKASRAKLYLLHVLTVTQAMAVDLGGMPYYDPLEAINYTERYLTAYAAEARDAGIDCEVLVREGPAPQQILACAQQYHVDRVLLGTRSRGKWGKLLIGSVAEQVLRSVPVPVLTAGPEADEQRTGVNGVRTILHATSLSQASRPSAALACHEAEARNARLMLMHVLPGGSSYALKNEHLRAYAERELMSILPDWAADRLQIETIVASGNPAVEILAEAHGRRPQLNVLGALMSPRLAAVAREGIAYRVIAHAPCPVLTICEHRPVLKQHEQEQHAAIS
jgi:nucleotide-binding universal stress UspA family protein